MSDLTWQQYAQGIMNFYNHDFLAGPPWWSALDLLMSVHLCVCVFVCVVS